MSVVTIVVVVFSLLGALDHMIGDKFGLGKEFERGIMMLGVMMMSMTGMIVIAPVLTDILAPLTRLMTDAPIDPSIIPASLLANDMGGAPLAVEMAVNFEIGSFNALVVSSMMGCTVSFTIPFALGVVEEKQHREVLIGLMCGIITIPVGCAVSGCITGLPVGKLFWNLLPLLIFSLILVIGLLKFPNFCVKLFHLLGKGINVLIMFGLGLGILRFLTGIDVIKGMDTLEEGAAICLNACAVMTGAFPLVYTLSKICAKPLKALGSKLGINEVSVMGIFASLATVATSFGVMRNMDKKGVVMNSAFAVSGAFVFASHLAFTMSFDSSYVGSVIVGKLIAGVLALIVANSMYDRLEDRHGIQLVTVNPFTVNKSNELDDNS